ncbi:MFS transporter [Amycolatopsis sp. NPDC004625]|uniref:MFS transporter n=1 Tax=Amycolatopsis sp. NPDC004625 TaxID=3154670 RepID=UPI0033B875BE
MSTTGYRSIATGPVLGWAATAVAARLPIAMAPLALVFLARGLPGGYAFGATLAAVWVLAEVIGAPVLGLWLRAERTKVHLLLAFGVAAGCYWGLAFGPSLPTPVVVVLTFVAGFAPAASPGGLRALLTRLVPEDDVAKVLSAEVMLNGLIWAGAPAVVAFLAVGAGPGAPMAVAGTLNLLALVLVVVRLPEGAPDDGGGPAARVTAKTLAAPWPVYLTAAASMAMVSTIELVLPALIESRGLSVATVGPLLVVFWVSSVAGGVVYGRRRWPGSASRQSLVCLVVTTAALSAVAVLPGVAGIGATLALGGLFQAAVLVTRNLSLRERLPAAAHAAGYSIMYAATGIGYSVVAAASALALRTLSPAVAIGCGGAITVVIVAISAVAERRPVRLPTSPPS